MSVGRTAVLKIFIKFFLCKIWVGVFKSRTSNDFSWLVLQSCCHHLHELKQLQFLAWHVPAHINLPVEKIAVGLLWRMLQGTLRLVSQTSLLLIQSLPSKTYMCVCIKLPLKIESDYSQMSHQGQEEKSL